LHEYLRNNRLTIHIPKEFKWMEWNNNTCLHDFFTYVR
jgi:hypothetical protein